MSAEVVHIPKRPGPYGQKVAAEVRAEAARRRVTSANLATVLHVSAASMSRRMNGHLPISFDELLAIASTLDVPITALIPPADPGDGQATASNGVTGQYSAATVTYLAQQARPERLKVPA